MYILSTPATCCASGRQDNKRQAGAATWSLEGNKLLPSKVRPPHLQMQGSRTDMSMVTSSKKMGWTSELARFRRPRRWGLDWLAAASTPAHPGAGRQLPAQRHDNGPSALRRYFGARVGGARAREKRRADATQAPPTTASFRGQSSTSGDEAVEDDVDGRQLAAGKTRKAHNLRRDQAALAQVRAYKTAAAAMCCGFEPPLPATESTPIDPQRSVPLRATTTPLLPRLLRHEVSRLPLRPARQPVSASR